MKHLALTFIALSFNLLNGQDPVFMKPGLSFRYDTAVMYEHRHYDFYEKESCSFKPVRKSDSFFLIIYSSPFYPLTQGTGIDSFMNNSMLKLRQANDTFRLLKSMKYTCRNFHGFLSWGQNKKKAKENIYFAATMQYFGNEGQYCIIYTNPVGNTSFNSKDSLFLDNFIANITLHRHPENESKTIANAYSVTVKPLPVINSGPFYIRQGKGFVMKTIDEIDSITPEIRQSLQYNTFRGELQITPALSHKVKTIKVKGGLGWQLFQTKSEGGLIFEIKDRETGHIEKDGILVLLTDFGMEVEVPFKFSYENK